MQILQTDLHIFLLRILREFGLKSKYSPFGNQLSNSHNLDSWWSADVVRRKWWCWSLLGPKGLRESQLWWKVHLAYPASLQALHSNNFKQIIQIEYNYQCFKTQLAIYKHGWGFGLRRTGNKSSRWTWTLYLCISSPTHWPLGLTAPYIAFFLSTGWSAKSCNSSCQVCIEQVCIRQ